jgi:polysaccharide chain length determinant protein (PEP-CTERM system associated)
MQPTLEPISVGRRPLDVEDYIDIVRRHKGWIAGPTFAALVLSVVGAFVWPDTYVSEAVVQVVPPQVPERYVSPNVNSEMSHRIQLMAQDILSRPSLINIINAHDLYRRERQRKPLEDVIEQMKNGVKISPVVSLQIQQQRMPISAFRVSFRYSDRFRAQKVTQELVSRFIDENARQLYSQSAATTDFLTSQWEAAKKALEEMEARITKFRMENTGRLPDESGANLQALQALQTQLMGVNDAIARANEDKLLLENQIRIYRDQLQELANGSDFTLQAKSERLTALEREILVAEGRLAAARERYKESHPDVKALTAELNMLRRRRDALLKEEQEAGPQAAPGVTAMMRRNMQQIEANIASLQGQVEAKNLEIAERTKIQQKLNESIATLTARVQAAPAVGGQYAELTRDYALAKARYDELNTKKEQSEIARNLENRGQGERLQLLESASLPEKPTEPNRLLIVGSGLGVGLLAGIFFAGLWELKDTSLKNLKDARTYTGLPVLGTIPLLENDLVVRRKRRLAWVAWSAACIVGILAMSSSIYYYYYVARM